MTVFVLQFVLPVFLIAVLNKNSKSGHPCLVAGLRGNAFSFSTVENDVSCRFVIYALYYV